MQSPSKKSIVATLDRWVTQRMPELTAARIQVDASRRSSGLPYAGVGFITRRAIVTFRVWELTTFQTELIVVDAPSKKTLRCIDGAPQDPEEIVAILDGVVQSLISGKW